jgi:hypothetical protein
LKSPPKPDPQCVPASLNAEPPKPPSPEIGTCGSIASAGAALIVKVPMKIAAMIAPARAHIAGSRLMVPPVMLTVSPSASPKAAQAVGSFRIMSAPHGSSETFALTAILSSYSCRSVGNAGRRCNFR